MTHLQGIGAALSCGPPSASRLWCQPQPQPLVCIPAPTHLLGLTAVGSNKHLQGIDRRMPETMAGSTLASFPLCWLRTAGRLSLLVKSAWYHATLCLTQVSGLGRDSAGNSQKTPSAAGRPHCLLSKTPGNGMKSGWSCLPLAAGRYTAFIEVADKPGTDAEDAMQCVCIFPACPQPGCF